MTQSISIDAIKVALIDHDPETSHSEKAERNAAVALIIADHPDHGLAALFIKRAEHPNDHWSGQMALPGGRHESHDETIMHAAIREAHEEVGITLAEEMCIGRLHDLYGGRLKSHRIAVSAFVFHYPGIPELTPNYEVADTVWVPIEFMRHPSNTSPYKFHLDPEQRDFPAFVYNSYTIWGLTYRILTNFFHLFGIEYPGEPQTTDVE